MDNGHVDIITNSDNDDQEQERNEVAVLVLSKVAINDVPNEQLRAGEITYYVSALPSFDKPAGPSGRAIITKGCTKLLDFSSFPTQDDSNEVQA